MKDIIVAGCAILDIIKQIDVYPQPTSLARIKNQNIAVGGALCNTGVDLKKLCPDLNIKTIGVLGNDSNGAFVIDCLKKNNIDISLMSTIDLPTGYTDVMNESNGRRTFFHNQGANATLTEKHFESLTSENTELVHIGYLLLLDYLDSNDDEYGTKMARLLHSLQEKGIKTSIDVVSEDSERFMKIVPPSLKYCDYVVMNEFEGGRITQINPRNQDGSLNIKNLKKILVEMKKLGVKRKAVIHCPECGAIIDENNEICVVPSLDLPKDYIKSSVGAGDAFAAGCLLGFMKGYDNEYILRLSSCASALNLSVVDSISGGKNEKETIVLENTYKRRSELC